MVGLGEKYRKNEKSLYSWTYMDWPAFDSLLKKILKKNSKIIDVGCGDGRVIHELLKYGVKQKNLFGIDIDDEMITIAKERFPDVEFEVGDAIRWKPVQKERFDIAIAFHVLHYFNRKEMKLLMRGIYESLNKNGRFVFLTAHPIRWTKGSLSTYFDGGSRLIDTTWGTKMRLSLNTIEDYTEALRESGFQIEYLLEPKPMEKGKVDEVNYVKYREGPHRLLIQAKKI